MSAELRGILEAYTAVYDDGVKETLNSIHDEITEMDLSLITDSELSEIAEAALQELFDEGYTLFGAEVILEDVIFEASSYMTAMMKGQNKYRKQQKRQEKIDRVKGAVRGAVDKAKMKASTGAVKAYGAYRKAKQSVDDKARRAGQTARNMSAQTARKASEAKATAKSGLKRMIRKAADRVASGASKVAKRMTEGYGFGDVDEKLKAVTAIPKKEQEAARKRLLAKAAEKRASMKKEEVSKIRKDWGDAYASIYEKKMSKEDHKKAAKAGKRWQDSDGDGKWYEPGEDVKEDAHMKKGECENCGGKGCEKCMDKKMKKESVQFSEAELEAIQAKVDSWED